MAQDRKIAALSVGATSVMMLVNRRYATGNWEYVNELTANTELAEGIELDGAMRPEAMARTVEAMRDMYKIAEMEGVDRVIVVANSAIRKASNLLDFLQMCKDTLNLSYLEILQPKEEASLSFLGVTSDLNESGPVLQIDLGGCVTRVVYGTETKTQQVLMLNFGYLDLTDRFHLDHFVFFLHKYKVVTYVERELAPYASDLYAWIQENDPHIIVSGAIITSFVGMRNKQIVIERNQVHGTNGTMRQVLRVYKRIARTFPAMRRHIVGVEQDRIRMIPGALLILYALLQFLKKENFRITASGLRSGVLKRYEIMEITEQTVASLTQEGFY